MVAMVRSAALTGYAELARSLGLNPTIMTGAVDLPIAALDDPSLLIPAGRVGRLLELSAQASGREDFGVLLAETRQPSNLGLVALVVREQATLHDGVAALARYARLHTAAISLRLEPVDDAWRIQPLMANRRGLPMRQSVDLTMGVLHRSLAAIFGASWRPDLICFAHPAPADPAAHRRIFGPQLQFDAPQHGMVCSAATMHRRRDGTDQAASRDLQRHLDLQLSNTAQTLPDQVRDLITALLPSADCDADALALRLGMDRRTLHRRLSRDGTNFATLLDATRQDLARQYLANQHIPLQTVAINLGFGAQAVFSRWFRDRFGCTARDWRKRL